MGFSISLPTIGQPNSTEDVKVNNSLTAISTWGNGNVLDTDLNSPNNSVRRVLLQASAWAAGAVVTGDYLVGFQTASPSLYASGTNTTSTFPIWGADSGVSSQPQDFQVANKTATARVRGTMMVNATAPGVTFTLGLYQITATGGGAGLFTLTFGTALAGSTVALATPAIGSRTTVESAAFALPSSAAVYALGVNVSGGTMAANSMVQITSQLLAYNA